MCVNQGRDILTNTIMISKRIENSMVKKKIHFWDECKLTIWGEAMIAEFSLSCVQIENVDNQYTCWKYISFWKYSAGCKKTERLTRFNHKLSSHDKHIESHDTATQFGKILRLCDWKKNKKMNINARSHWAQQITTRKLQRGRRGFNQGAKENIALKIYDNRQIAAVSNGENKSTVETNVPKHNS